MRRTTSLRHRGSVVLIVMWALAIAALLVSSVQLFGYRQAMLGREALARVQARWAARGGVEYTIAVMAAHTQDPVPDDAFAMVREMEEISVGGLINATYAIHHHADGRDWAGPMDEHSKININSSITNANILLLLTDITPDVVDAILDWIDEDDEVREQGAERDYYLSLEAPYLPRNGPMRTIAELELIAGIWPEHVRGEDWNLNNQVDPNEDDGDLTWPIDEPNHQLEAGWSAILTAYSVQGPLGASGLPRIYLAEADPLELQDRLNIDEEQATALINYAASNTTTGLEQLLTMQIEQELASDRSANRGGSTAPTSESPTLSLTRDQLRAVLAETTLENVTTRAPGRLNINTVSEQLLRQLLVTREHLADEIVYLRNTRVQGIASLVDLLDIPAFREETGTLEYLGRIMGTRSNVYSICSQGRSQSGGVEVEIIVVVDRSTLPIRILEYREL
ncbi:MAG: type II secretion system protein GspK [Planctomycetota bacterium]|nr:type II secretion system protein GspK [Planctomycetota bacterium]